MMKFCVMMAAQSNAVANVGGVLRKESVGENMVRLKVAVASAAAAYTVTRDNLFGPSLAHTKVSKCLLSAAVHVVGVSPTLMLFATAILPGFFVPRPFASKLGSNRFYFQTI